MSIGIESKWANKYAVSRKRRQYNEHPERANYAKYHHCNGCMKNFPLTVWRCGLCGNPLRYGPTNKKHTKLFEGY